MDSLLRTELVRDEGLRLHAYKDSVGLWTIGVGHLLGDTPRMTVITEREAYALLEDDIDSAAALISTHLACWSLINDVRRRALVNMAFNLGNRLLQFKQFLGAVDRASQMGPDEIEQWILASAHMLNSKWATQVGDRAKRLAIMIEKGIV